MDEAAQLTALATAGAAALRTGEQWRSLLYRTERFGQLGFVNTMLIWAQCPDAVQVHDYVGWKRLGRQVIRGEHGIRILGDPGQVTTVFDLLQTTGEPQPVLIKGAKNGEAPSAESWRALVALASLDDVVFGSDGEQAAAERLARSVAAKLLAGRSGAGLAGQLEIESVAFLIASRLGLGTGGFGFPHVTSWAGADPRAGAERIVAAVWERITSATARASAVIDLYVPAATRLVVGPRLAATERTTPPVPPKILETAARYYVRRLAGSWVPAYLAARGFDGSVLRQWGIGYAPGGWTALTEHLREIGYQDAAIEAAGLAQRSKRGTFIDVLRDRAVFPVRSADGTVAGFLGRAASDAQARLSTSIRERPSSTTREMCCSACMKVAKCSQVGVERSSWKDRSTRSP
jgi:DNA primase